MSDLLQDMNRVFEEADCLATEHQVEQAIDTMAQKITGQLADHTPLVLCTMNGGLILTGKLLPKLVFPLQCDFIHATRYRHETSGGALQWRVNPEIDMKGRHVLVVDDILDEGATLAAILQHCREAGAEAVYSAVLINKLHDRKFDKALEADFCGMDIEDRFLFGYGMDYKGYWRNAPGIYAVKGM